MGLPPRLACIGLQPKHLLKTGFAKITSLFFVPNSPIFNQAEIIYWRGRKQSHHVETQEDQIKIRYFENDLRVIWKFQI